MQKAAGSRLVMVSIQPPHNQPWACEGELVHHVVHGYVRLVFNKWEADCEEADCGEADCWEGEW